MRVRILGCSGGIGGRHLRTTSMLIDQDILVDAGTGVGDLSIAELVRVDHVFITHTHLDHIACLPLIADTVGDQRDKPLTVHGTAEILAILKAHVFNGHVWPDFTEIPSIESPFLRFQEIRVGEPVYLGERAITAIEVNHTVSAVGYILDSGQTSLIFSGDTTICPGFWARVNGTQNLRYLIVECAFSNKEFDLAKASKHLCPSMLAQELSRLRREVELFITHLKPGQIELTMLEIEDSIGDYRPRMLKNNQVFEL